MTARVTVASYRYTLLWMQRGMFGCAFLLLGYCGFSYVDAWTFQRSAGVALDVSFHPGSPRPPSAPGDILGRIEIPRLDVSVVVVEGTSERALGHAAGHIAGTGTPGHPGNIGIAAHRDSYFRRLKDIEAGDSINLTTGEETYRYRVVSTAIVPPAETAVLRANANDDEILTLVTCYPFYFVGPAPKRFIVRAARIGRPLS